jgi:hypothetical protein
VALRREALEAMNAPESIAPNGAMVESAATSNCFK